MRTLFMMLGLLWMALGAYLVIWNTIGGWLAMMLCFVPGAGVIWLSANVRNS